MKSKNFLKKSTSKQKSISKNSLNIYHYSSNNSTSSLQSQRRKVHKPIKKYNESQQQQQSRNEDIFCTLYNILTGKYYRDLFVIANKDVIDGILYDHEQIDPIWFDKQQYVEIQKFSNQKQQLIKCYHLKQTAGLIKGLILGLLDKLSSKEFHPISYGLNKEFYKIIKKRISAKNRIYLASLSAKKSSNNQATTSDQQNKFKWESDKKIPTKKGRFNKQKFKNNILNAKQFQQPSIKLEQSMEQIRFWTRKISKMKYKVRPAHLIQDLQIKYNNKQIFKKQRNPQFTHKRVHTQGFQLFQVEQEISYIKKQQFYQLQTPSQRQLSKSREKRQIKIQQKYQIPQYNKISSSNSNLNSQNETNRNNSKRKIDHKRHHTEMSQYYDQAIYYTPNSNNNNNKNSNLNSPYTTNTKSKQKDFSKGHKRSNSKSSVKKSVKGISIQAKLNNPFLAFKQPTSPKSQNFVQYSPISTKSKKSKKSFSLKKQQQVITFKKSFNQRNQQKGCSKKKSKQKLK